MTNQMNLVKFVKNYITNIIAILYKFLYNVSFLIVNWGICIALQGNILRNG